MRPRTLTVSLALFCVPSLAFGLAQEQTGGADAAARHVQDAQEKKAHYMTASKLIGMDVWSSADADGDRSDCGDVHDLVVDSASGEITHVIVSSGGVGTLGDSLRKLPYSNLKFDRSEEDVKVWIDKTEEQFDEIAKIEESDLDAYRGDEIAKDWKEKHAKLREASARGEDGRAREAAMNESCQVLASDLDDLQVRAAAGSMDEEGKSVAGESLGELEDAWIDCATGKVSFVTFKHDDRTLAMPLGALQPQADHEEEMLFVITPMPSQHLSKAPAYDEEKGHTFDSGDFRTKVATFYETKTDRDIDGTR